MNKAAPHPVTEWLVSDSSKPSCVALMASVVQHVFHYCRPILGEFLTLQLTQCLRFNGCWIVPGDVDLHPFHQTPHPTFQPPKGILKGHASVTIWNSVYSQTYTQSTVVTGLHIKIVDMLFLTCTRNTLSVFSFINLPKSGYSASPKSTCSPSTMVSWMKMQSIDFGYKCIQK